MSLDAVGARHVGAYGHSRATTPNLDALAEEGLLFEAAYTQQAWTLTAHITMMNGLSSAAHGASKQRAATPAVPMLAEVAWAHGFATAAFVGLPVLVHPRHGLGRGFDHFQMGSSDAARDAPPIVAWLRRQAELAERDPEHRFFLFVHYYDAHSDYRVPVPYHVPPPHGERFAPKGETWGRRGGTRLLQRLALEGASERDREFVHAYYDAGVRYVDEQGVAPLVTALDELGLARDTLLVVTADHGEELFEHGSVLHGHPYDETARVPLVMRGPGLPSGRRVDRLAGLVDLAPTVLGRLGLPSPEGIEGRDLAPTWLSGEAVREAVFVDGGQEGERRYPSAVVADRGERRLSYLAVVREPPTPGAPHAIDDPGELYDLRRDPLQKRDLARLEPELVRGLGRQLSDWFDQGSALAERLGHGEDTGALSEAEQRQLEALGYGAP